MSDGDIAVAERLFLQAVTKWPHPHPQPFPTRGKGGACAISLSRRNPVGESNQLEKARAAYPPAPWPRGEHVPSRRISFSVLPAGSDCAAEAMMPYAFTFATPFS